MISIVWWYKKQLSFYSMPKLDFLFCPKSRSIISNIFRPGISMKANADTLGGERMWDRILNRRRTPTSQNKMSSAYLLDSFTLPRRCGDEESNRKQKGGLYNLYCTSQQAERARLPQLTLQKRCYIIIWNWRDCGCLCHTLLIAVVHSLYLNMLTIFFLF